MASIEKQQTRAVPLDTADEIKELADEGFGRNLISTMTGIPAGTVRAVLDGTHKTYVDDLTTRQTTKMISGWGVVR